jgi:hypothetical protein
MIFYGQVHPIVNATWGKLDVTGTSASKLEVIRGSPVRNTPMMSKYKAASTYGRGPNVSGG